MELVEDLGTNVNQCSQMNVFCNIGQDHSLTINQCLS